MGVYEQLGEDDQERNWEIPPEAYNDIRRTIQRLPNRDILDFLVRFYETEIHW